MNIARLEKLAEHDTDLRELLDDRRISEKEIERIDRNLLWQRLKTFDSDHRQYEKALSERLKAVESGLIGERAYCKELNKRITELETASKAGS